MSSFLASFRVLCETVKSFIAKVGVAYAKENIDDEDTIAHKVSLFVVFAYFIFCTLLVMKIA